MKIKYIAPSLRHVDLRSNSGLCASGEQTKLPVGIDIASYGTVEVSEDNDW